MVQLTGSSFLAALVQTAVFLPMLLLALAAGVMAKRHASVCGHGACDSVPGAQAPCGMSLSARRVKRAGTCQRNPKGSGMQAETAITASQPKLAALRFRPVASSALP
jgi:hypothetical protein